MIQACRRVPLFRTAIFLMGLSLPLGAQDGPAVPEPLLPWVPWVLEKHPELPCPLLGEERLCAWPGRLSLDLDERGGTFRLEVTADREIDLPLPGSPALWPRDVTSDGRPALMLRAGERPAVRLEQGRHRLAGRFAWSRLPESLPVPEMIALVDLELLGAPVRAPRREGEVLWLARSRRVETEQDRLSLEVERRIADGVPVTLQTRLRLRVSGAARTVDLGSALLEGFVLTGLGGELPLRWSENERLVVQARPGTWVLTLRARSEAPITEMRLVEDRGELWPEEELWAFEADPAVRAVRLSGAAGLDPQRTSLPEEWKTLPIFQIVPGTTLRFEELRRGEAEPPPDALRVRRVFWLEQAGDRLSVRDRITGDLYEGGRLEASEPAVLGRFGLGSGVEMQDQVITEEPSGGRPGVEMRARELNAEAEITYPSRGALPAVGWNHDVQSLAVELRTPPGWTLLAAPGVDRAQGSWIDRWTLLDLFLMLILTLATWRLDDRRWGILALVFLGLAWHEPKAFALVLWWLLLLPMRALLRVLSNERSAWLRGLRWIAVAGFAFQALVFCADQWRTGLFPQLEAAAPTPSGLTNPAAESQAVRLEPPVESSPSGARYEDRSRKSKPGRSARQIDRNAVVQTGSGLPSWTWRTYHLHWNGPVTSDQTMRLLVVSPGVERVLSMLRILAAVLLGWCLIDPRKSPGAVLPGGENPPSDEPPAAVVEPVASTVDADASQKSVAGAAGAALIFFVLTAPAPYCDAQEDAGAPPPDVLAELERRLVQPPPCHPRCVEMPRLFVRADARGLRLDAEVHAAARSAWPLPGPASVWMPSSVRVDGAEATALRWGENGFFLLRLEPGVHRVELEGPARDSFALELPLRPRALDWQGDGWTLDGWRSDDPPPGALRLERQLPLVGAEAMTDGAFEPAPWLEVARELDIGIPWLVHSELRRRGPAGKVVLVRLPLLPGESVTTAGITVENGEALVGLEPDETVRRFESTLEEADTLRLTAPRDRPFMERWELRCSPVWSCSAEGLAPTRHMQEGAWRPLWQPWPGEEVTLFFARPRGASGQTTAFDRVDFELKPGRRLLEAHLGLEIRASRGGEKVLSVPKEAVLQAFEIDGQAYPTQMEEGRVAFTLEPGAHRLEATWRQDHRAGFFERVPAVSLGSEAVDVTVRVKMPTNRWLLWTGGPGWGPVVQFWQYLLVLALAGWALGRWAPSPLRPWDWILLGAGLTQVPLAAAAFVVGWLLLLSLRHHVSPSRWWRYNLMQVSLFGLGLISLGVLYVAIHSGLLLKPEMQVLAPGNFKTSSSVLEWYVDRANDTLPRPWVLSLPLFVFRILMLFWSLWLASRLLRWIPWIWERLTPGPILVSPKSYKRWQESG